jgi:hypothetical protein
MQRDMVFSAQGERYAAILGDLRFQMFGVRSV